ncbi:hypothetical protein ABIF60_006113 [Bradyrhizobium japonicum]
MRFQSRGYVLRLGPAGTSLASRREKVQPGKETTHFSGGRSKTGRPQPITNVGGGLSQACFPFDGIAQNAVWKQFGLFMQALRFVG